MDDEELARRFSEGDEGAVRLVYERFSGPVTTVAMSYLRDRDLAAEAVQQSFLQAWRGASTFDPSRPLAPWIYSVARRVALDLRRREARAAQTPGDDVLEQAAEPAEGPSMERTWLAWEVRAALDELPDDERQVVRLSHFEQLTHSEIADELGVAVGTVKSRSHRAHRRLAARLRNAVEDEQ